MSFISVRTVDATHVSVTLKGSRRDIRHMFIHFFRLLMEKQYFTAAELHDAITVAELLSPSDAVDTYSVTVLDIP